MSKVRTVKYLELTALKGLIREKKSSYKKLSEAINNATNTFCHKINGYQMFDCLEIDIIANQLDIEANKINYYFFPHMLSGATREEYIAMQKVV